MRAGRGRPGSRRPPSLRGEGPAVTRMEARPLAPVIAIVPSFLTLSLLLMVTASPPVGLTEPVELIRMSSLAVPVRTGAVTAVLITVSALAKPGHVASEATDPLMPALRKFEAGLPEGYRMEIVGELKEQIRGQRQSLNVVLASVIAITRYHAASPAFVTQDFAPSRTYPSPLPGSCAPASIAETHRPTSPSRPR